MTLVRAAVLISAPIAAVYEEARERARRPVPWLGGAVPAGEQPPARFALAGVGPGRHDWAVRRTCWLVQTGAGTLLTDELTWVPPLGPPGRMADTLLLRGRLLRFLVTNAAAVKAAAERAAPTTVDGQVVVGAALLDPAGRVLAAQRSRPPELAGRWEFPGGKVEPGESETAALIRECQEELGVRVRLDARLGGDLPVQGGAGVLRVWTGRITAGQPSAREHRALRWLAPDELDDVDWLPADRPLIDLLRPPTYRP
ncbi:MAG: 8-oxo-dGTP diphosphatase [Mycobacteriales bacterium]